MQNPIVEVKMSAWAGYELLDSGSGRKLESFGGRTVVRPEAKAWWKPELPDREWGLAGAEFDTRSGLWKTRGDLKRSWTLEYNGIKLEARLNDNSKHLGVFPEQSPHWDFIARRGREARSPSMLSIFGYTGAATLAALAAGYSVTHVDASTPSVGWARRNLDLSGMKDKPVRWIVDDAMKFVRREIRRNSRYDAVILDPPAFGRGPKGEIWKLDNSLPELLDICFRLLSDKPLFVILTIYNIEASALMPANVIADITRGRGRISCGELALRQKNSSKILPLSIYNLWER